MPPSHSAIVTALAVAIGLHDGLGGSTFATALILACIVMYDATGVRLHAGCQTEEAERVLWIDSIEGTVAIPSPFLCGHLVDYKVVSRVLVVLDYEVDSPTVTLFHCVTRFGDGYFGDRLCIRADGH
ncbi:acid phosphatase/vanadium-dependent haloperoxidase protein-related protein [Tanacetum coccineum]